MGTITLRDYEAAERAMARESATIGLVVHAVITLLVSGALIFINVLLVPEFPWSAFAVGCMLIGLAVHWWFGHVKLDEQLRKQQETTEARAAKMA